MKKLLCFLLCLTLIFSSISLSFAASADWTTTDQNNLSNASTKLTNIYNTLSSGGSIYNLLNTISNTLVDVKNYLFDDGHDVAYWVHEISDWMSPLYQSIVSLPTSMTSITEALWKPLSNGSSVSYNALIEKYLSPEGMRPFWVNNPSRNTSILNANGTLTTTAYDLSAQGIPGSQLLFTWQYGQNAAQFYNSFMAGWNNPVTVRNWNDLSGITTTPDSGIRGFYNLIAYIQNPVARLAYVLASSERIEAQQAAAANEEAVVDNFIDSSGDGSASPSDISSVSDLSSGYKQNFGTDASPSGIFDIFNSDHSTWFSQETKNQLDTTTPTRLSKGSDSETPLLDKQIKNIYDALGVKQP